MPPSYRILPTESTPDFSRLALPWLALSCSDCLPPPPRRDSPVSNSKSATPTQLTARRQRHRSDPSLSSRLGPFIARLPKSPPPVRPSRRRLDSSALAHECLSPTILRPPIVLGRRPPPFPHRRLLWRPQLLHGVDLRCRHEGVAARCRRGLGSLGAYQQDCRRFQSEAGLPARQWRRTSFSYSLPPVCTADNCFASQTKTIEVSVDALTADSDPSLPPLMNPTMLEASDDLTNLSHLNEPAGRHTRPLSPVVTR